MPITDHESPGSQRVLNRLMRRTARGDWKSFNLLYAMTSAKLYGLMLHMTNYAQSCEDLLQEAYIKVWKQADRFDPDRASVSTWLNAIARHTVIDWLRSQGSGMQRLTSDQSPEALELAGGVDPQQNADSDAVGEALSRCMEQLNDSQRQAIFMAYTRGMSHSEMVDQFQRPLGTVKSWVRRGLELLRSCLSRTGGEL